MKLFIFEGEEREPAIFRSMEYLFFRESQDKIICSYGNNIYNLYKEISDDGTITDDLYFQDIVPVLQARLDGDSGNPLLGIDRSDISEIYLFFDYDIHNQNMAGTLDPADLNEQLAALLAFFDDETDHGKLYVNYPMVESIRYTKKLPDHGYNAYTYPVAGLASFREAAADFSYYKNLDFIALRFRRNREIVVPSEAKLKNLQRNWKLLAMQNAMKADYICNGRNEMLPLIHDIAQMHIFSSQRYGFFPEGNISILNSFPLFLYEYFGTAFCDIDELL